MAPLSVDTPAAIRTRDLQLRRLTLYPAELRVPAIIKIHQTTLPVNLWPEDAQARLPESSLYTISRIIVPMIDMIQPAV